MRWDADEFWDSGIHWDQPSVPIQKGVRRMLFKLLIGFDRLSGPDFLAVSQGIKTALTSEPALTLLPDPWPAAFATRVQLTDRFTDFEEAFDAAVNGGQIE